MKVEASLRILALNVERYLDQLKKQGIEELGDGWFSTVFQHPTMPDMVVKVTTGDTGFATYYDFCEKNKGNPWLPRFDSKASLGRDPKKKGNVILYFMEKLDPAPAAVQRVWCDTLLDSLPPAIRKKLKIKYEERGPFEALEYEGWSALAQHSDMASIRPVAAFFAKQGWRTDLHLANVMLRHKGHIVFNDPLVSEKK